MTRTEEEALLLWSELQSGHPTMSDIELIEHHLELAKQELSKQQRAAVWEEARKGHAIWQDNHGDFYDKYHCNTFTDYCEQRAKELKP